MSFDELAFKANLAQITREQNQQEELAQTFYKKALTIKGVEGMEEPQMPKKKTDAPSL